MGELLNRIPENFQLAITTFLIGLFAGVVIGFMFCRVIN